MKYYIVIGTAGSYGDISRWPVAVYTDEESANKHAKLAEERCSQLFFYGWNYRSASEFVNRDFGKEIELRKTLNPYDPNWQSETYYSVEEVEQGPLFSAANTSLSRANGSGQCVACPFISHWLEDGKIDNHYPYTAEYQKRWNRPKNAEFCPGGKQDPRPIEQEDHNSWLEVYRINRSIY